MSRSAIRDRPQASAQRREQQHWEFILGEQSTSPGKSAAEGARWVDPFKNGLALYTIMLNVGIGLHALDVFIIALTVLVLEGSLISAADVHVGLIAFAAAVLLSTIGLKRMATLIAGQTADQSRANQSRKF